MTILVVGLGKLGLPIASFLSKRSGHAVYGWDISQDYRSDLLGGTFETSEPDCDYERIRIVPEVRCILEIMPDLDFVSICVNTPSNLDGSMDLGQVIDACQLLNGYATGLLNRLPVVINSTIMPGTCEMLNTRFSHLHVMSNPVWIAIGSVMKDLQNPPGFVIGCDCDKDSGYLIACAHNKILGTWMRSVGKPVNPLVTTTKTAEFIKLYHNQWCTAKMSSIGWVGDHASELGINIDDISWFMVNGGERPGMFWKYGPPYGGPCFPRDLEFYRQVFPIKDRDRIAVTVQEVNHLRLWGVVRELTDYSYIAILGTSYKYGVSVEEASFAYGVARELRVGGKTVWVVDSLDEIPKDQLQSIEVWVVHHSQLANQVPEGATKIDLWRQR